jgi:hypothetical protein
MRSRRFSISPAPFNFDIGEVRKRNAHWIL